MQVRSFLGLIGFYRKFIPNFAEIALPLTYLMRKGQPTKIGWEESQERAFNQLKQVVCSSPVLKLPNLKEHFVFRTDASDRGLGAILLQEEAGAVACASRKRLPREELLGN
jgi:hypothetical protein